MSNISISFILFIFCFSCMSPQKFRQRAEFQKSEFLKKAKSTWQIKKELSVEGAVYTIIHIKQQHYSDIVTKRTLKALKKERDIKKIRDLKLDYYNQVLKINQVQKEIYDFLLSMSSYKDYLYVEGRSFPHHYRDRFLAEFIPQRIAAVRKVLDYSQVYSQELPSTPYFLGASISIHQKRKMNVVGAENLSLLNLTLSLYESEKLNKADLGRLLKECHEAREDQMIKNMSENFDDLPYLMSSLRFLICGSKHDLKNNIENWNSKNPEKKFNLLSFTPSMVR